MKSSATLDYTPSPGDRQDTTVNVSTIPSSCGCSVGSKALMTETKGEEHERLQRRTSDLKREHADLDRDRTPLSQDAHDQHSENLRRHNSDLAAHKQRPDDKTHVAHEPMTLLD